MAEEMHKAFLSAAVGTTLSVLFETQENGYSTGHSDTYLPVSVPGQGLRGQLRRVLISEAREGQLFGHLAD